MLCIFVYVLVVHVYDDYSWWMESGVWRNCVMEWDIAYVLPMLRVYMCTYFLCVYMMTIYGEWRVVCGDVV